LHPNPGICACETGENFLGLHIDEVVCVIEIEFVGVCLPHEEKVWDGPRLTLVLDRLTSLAEPTNAGSNRIS
jgi:hypothetical protein